MEFKELIADFAARVGVTESVEVDEESRCAFEIDGMGVIAQGLDEIGIVSLLAFIAPPPPERLERLYRRLLEANHLYRETFGATLSVDPESGLVCLVKHLPAATLDGEGFFREAGLFTNVIAHWKAVVENFRDAPGDGESGGVAAPSDDFVIRG